MLFDNCRWTGETSWSAAAADRLDASAWRSMAVVNTTRATTGGRPSLRATVVNYARALEGRRPLDRRQGVEVVFEHVGPEPWRQLPRSGARRLVTCGRPRYLGPTTLMPVPARSDLGVRPSCALPGSLTDGAGLCRHDTNALADSDAIERRRNRDVFGKVATLEAGRRRMARGPLRHRKPLPD